MNMAAYPETIQYMRKGKPNHPHQHPRTRDTKHAKADTGTAAMIQQPATGTDKGTDKNTDTSQAGTTTDQTQTGTHP